MNIPKLPRSMTALATGVLLQFLCATSLHSAVITNDAFAKDTAGNNIYAQGGGVFKFGSKWYWYGVKYNGAVTYANNPAAGKNSDTSFNSFTCYSSTDLVNWVNEGPAMTTSSAGMSGTAWVGRMGVAYHAATNKYVLVSQYAGPNGNGVMFATSSTPNGDFVFHHVQSPMPTSNGFTGDQTVFIDDNGAAYLICSKSDGRNRLYVLPFRASDYLNIEAGPEIYSGAGREGNCMFRYGNRYYFLSSDLYGWNASRCYVLQSSGSSILGTYNAEYVMNRSALDYCHVSQTGFGVTVPGTSGTAVLFVGDRWCDFAGNGVGFNQWCPVTFSGTTPTFQSVSKFDLNAAAGTWAVVNGNNHILNPNFDADRVAVTDVVGWTESGTAGAFGNFLASHNPGRFAYHHYSASAFNVFTNQVVTGLPNGTYTLRVWYKSSGGQPTARFFVRNFGGTEIQYSVTTAKSAWTEAVISNINVTNGQADVGLYTVGNAGQWVDMDDWSLTRN